MSNPTVVTISSRFGERPDINVEWCPTDTIYDILVRAGIEPEHVSGVVVGAQFVRGLNTEPVWPGSVIELSSI